jgi:16S rRNA (guanine527-N7)-methyltransferase
MMKLTNVSLNIEKEMLLLKQKARKLGTDLNEFQLTQFDIYQKELLKWNAKTNLISEKSSQEIVSRHFLDSLTALQFIDNPQALIVDIGCGAGFPGIPLKIASPGLQLYLLETNRKKVSFLKHIVRLLNLAATEVLHERVENIMTDKQWKYFFDCIISRAAFKLPDLLAYGAFFLKPGGKLIALKGDDIAAEVSQCKPLLNQCYIAELFQYDIDNAFTGTPRKIIIGEKTK